MSVTGIDEGSIKKIEDFHNSNKQYINKLDCCYSEHYKQLENFELLPGHKYIILNIPKQMKEIQNKKIEKKNNKHDNMERKKTRNLLSNEELQAKLVKNLVDYSKYQGKIVNFEIPDNVLSEANIHDFRRESNGNDFLCKCRFSCPFCSKTYSVIYKKYWMTSNVTNHLKNHITEQ